MQHGSREAEAYGQGGTSIVFCSSLWNDMKMKLFSRTKALVSVRNGCNIRVAYAFPYERADDLLCHSKWYEVSSSDPKMCISLFRSFDCQTNEYNAYVCPAFATPGNKFAPNATITMTRKLVLDGSEAAAHTGSTAPRGALEYPVVDGFIEPWSNSGHLRTGLSFIGTQAASCSPVSQLTRLRTALRCVRSGGAIAYDPCFPSSAQRDPLAVIVACSTAPGSRAFIRVERT
jgi:hypothetical protein